MLTIPVVGGEEDDAAEVVLADELSFPIGHAGSLQREHHHLADLLPQVQPLHLPGDVRRRDPRR